MQVIVNGQQHPNDHVFFFGVATVCAAHCTSARMKDADVNTTLFMTRTFLVQKLTSVQLKLCRATHLSLAHELFKGSIVDSIVQHL